MAYIVGIDVTCSKLFQQQIGGAMLDWVGPLVMCRSEVDRIPPAIPGIYLLHAFAPAWGGYPVFYAGQTENLKRRLCEHLSDQSAKPVIAALRRLDRPYFSAAPVFDTIERLRREAGLIALLLPIANDVRPTIAPLFPDLPPMILRRRSPLTKNTTNEPYHAQ